MLVSVFIYISCDHFNLHQYKAILTKIQIFIIVLCTPDLIYCLLFYKLNITWTTPQ